MTPPHDDIHRALDYGHTHRTARELLLGAVAVFAVGAFLITTNQGWKYDAKGLLLGCALVAAAAVAVVIAMRARRQPSVASIVVSPDGVLFRDFSDKIIPWREIRDVDTAEVRMIEEHFATRVTKLVVSQGTFRSLRRRPTIDRRIAEDGEPSAIYLAYYHTLPFDEFHAAVLARWRAFGGHDNA